jgi:small subunit ribosomal protein S21
MKNFKNKIHNNNDYDNKPRKPREPKQQGLYVEVHGDDVMKAYRKFKKKVKMSGILDQMKDKQYYRKPSEIKREKRKASIRIVRKLTKEQEADRTMNIGRKR